MKKMTTTTDATERDGMPSSWIMSLSGDELRDGDLANGLVEDIDDLNLGISNLFSFLM